MARPVVKQKGPLSAGLFVCVVFKDAHRGCDPLLQLFRISRVARIKRSEIRGGI
jgi:hypothetical protein